MEAIRNGGLSFDALRRIIGVGTGNCKARRCRAKIEKMVKDYKESADFQVKKQSHPSHPLP
ncbi:MAG: hypothetical protein A3K09_07035 [Nitrospinae bacterium RIFCSPLOWO2_12_FULL_47_7]|nr:MAG: hypothetical protein A3K09_07035 [Nitrospinae bacterium RIFCSPLOWO2_12_FULL_47_7]